MTEKQPFKIMRTNGHDEVLGRASNFCDRDIAVAVAHHMAAIER